MYVCIFTPSYIQSNPPEATNNYSPITITNMSFCDISADVLRQSRNSILRILYFSLPMVSYTVTLENMYWFNNSINPTSVRFPTSFSLLHAEVLNKFSDVDSGDLIVDIHNLQADKNIMVSASDSLYAQLSYPGLLVFKNVVKATFSGNITVHDNSGGSSIFAVSTNIFLSGDLTLQNGSAFSWRGY